MMEIITIKDLLARNADKFREQVAFQIKADGDYRRITFGETAELVRKLQGQLVKLKVKHGDRVALISENRPEWPLSYLAITCLGAAVVPLDALLTKEDILPLLNDSGAKVIVLSQKFTDLYWKVYDGNI